MGIIIYTDGSAHPNPGPGGFGVVVLDKNEKLLYNYSRLYEKEKVTNNEMELKAILYSFLNYGVNINNQFLFNIEIPIVYSDSSYAVNILNDWMFNWANKGWLKSDNQKPENLDLIQAYYDWYAKGYRIELKKVRGHAGNQWNELADNLATGKITPEEAMKIYG